MSPSVNVEQIAQAAAILRAGGLVAFPTETVYGLGASAVDERAVRKIFAAKGRPADHPLIVHLGDPAEISAWCARIPDHAWRLAQRYWPGPLTIILPRGALAADVVTGGLNTVALRVPKHPAAQALLKEFGGAIAAPSANRFGRVSPTRAEHVHEELAGRVDLILDGGDCDVGLESTIVDLSGDGPTILRPGAITREQVEAACGLLAEPSADSPRCSGRLESHYAPRALVEIVDSAAELAARVNERLAQNLRVAVLSPEPPPRPSQECHWIFLSREPEECARQLYVALREVDRLECNVAVVVLPLNVGLGEAIRDRLQKAAGPRQR